MKLELLDAYNIRARLSASIILLAPIAVTTFLCFDKINTFASSAVFIGLLLAFTNYIPILLRRVYGFKQYSVNYAVEFLMPNDSTIDSIPKKRYYDTLAKIDPSFEAFLAPHDSEEFKKCCESAVIYLKSHTREDHLVQEENINYGFCRNLLRSKYIGIFLCFVLCTLIATFSFAKYETFSEIPTSHYFAFAINALMILFWCIGVTKVTLDNTAKTYAKTLLATIDSLKTY
ncbi:MAG: hypothetical protein IJY39_03160 [Clostridia bacterium]|nr:hypothetical protein [Clostridia bacterium]